MSVMTLGFSFGSVFLGLPEVNFPDFFFPGSGAKPFGSPAPLLFFVV